MNTHASVSASLLAQAPPVYASVPGPLGDMLLVGVESADAPGGTALVSLSFPDPRAVVREEWRHAPGAFTVAARQLGEYFDGRRTAFDLALVPAGTAFERRVWSALEAVPYGTTTTYGALAERLGVPRHEVRALGALAERLGVPRHEVRALGAAIGRNPLLVLRPCHRVIGADGTLKGYAAGVPRKERLLVLEGALPDRLPLI